MRLLVYGISPHGEMGFAREFADQVWFLAGARILEQRPPEQIFIAPRQEETQRFLARLLGGDRM